MIGVILLDWNTIVFRIYEHHTDGKLCIIDSKIKKLPTSTVYFPISSETCGDTINEIISQTEHYTITKWFIYARYLPNIKVQEVEKIVGHHIEEISLPLEQELLCRGLVTLH